MQFCSKSELYQSIKTCNRISTEPAAGDVLGASQAGGGGGGASSSSGGTRGGGSGAGGGDPATLFSADIDPPECAGLYDFPCWSVSDPHLRRALQSELPDDWQALLKLPAFRGSQIEKQTFFDRPVDTSKLTALLAGRQGAGPHGKPGEAEDAAREPEPRRTFVELFRKRPEYSSGSNDSDGNGNRDGDSGSTGAATTVATVGRGTPPPGAALNAAGTEPAATAVLQVGSKKRSGLHQLLFGADQSTTTSGGGGTGVGGGGGGQGGSGGGGAGGTAAGSAGGAGASTKGLTTIVVFLPDADRTKVELRVSPKYTMSRTLKLLMAQGAVKKAMGGGALPGHDTAPAAYELKLHDEDGYALDMAHNLGDQTVAETGEDEFVLQRRANAGAPRADGSSGAVATGAAGGVSAGVLGGGGFGTAGSRLSGGHGSPSLPQVSPGIKVLFSDLKSGESLKFKSFASQSGLQLRHWFPKLQSIGVIRVGEEYEFRLLPDDMKRLGRRSGLLPLDTPVGHVAQLGVREIKLCPKTYYDVPKHSSAPKTLARTMSTRSRSLTQGGINMSPRAINATESDSLDQVGDLTEFMFDEITGAAKKEWHVIKINNQKRRQERVIGVDMTRIYNSKPKDKFHFKGVTKKWRDIEDLESCPWPFDRKQPKRFRLVFRDQDEGGLVNIDYEAKTPQEAAHIVAKILYIQQNLLGH